MKTGPQLISELGKSLILFQNLKMDTTFSQRIFKATKNLNSQRNEEP